MDAVKNAVNAAATKFQEVADGTPASKDLVLVTGGTGFVAAHVLQSLLSRGYRVRTTVRSHAKAETVRKQHKRYEHQLDFAIVEDVAAHGAFDEAVKGVDGVIHTASPFVMSVKDNEKDLLDPAVKGTTSVLEAVTTHAPHVKRIVITSSFASILDLNQGTRPGYTYTENDWNPVTWDEARAGNGGTAYSGSKTFAEKAAWEFVEKRQPNFTIATICPPMIYGPLAHDASLDSLNTSSADIYRFMDGSMKGKEPGPTAFPAFADVRDVGEAHVLAYERRQKSNERYFITSGNFQYPDVCRIIREQVPEVRDNVPDPSLTKEVETFKADNSKAKHELGLKFTSLEKCIGDTARSLRLLQEGKNVPPIANAA